MICMINNRKVRSYWENFTFKESCIVNGIVMWLSRFALVYQVAIKQMEFTFTYRLNIGNQPYPSKTNMRNYVSLMLLNHIRLNLKIYLQWHCNMP